MLARNKKKDTATGEKEPKAQTGMSRAIKACRQIGKLLGIFSTWREKAPCKTSGKQTCLC